MAAAGPGYVMAAGGSVTVSGPVRDDLRVAGGDVTVSGMVADNAALAGGTDYLFA